MFILWKIDSKNTKKISAGKIYRMPVLGGQSREGKNESCFKFSQIWRVERINLMTVPLGMFQHKFNRLSSSSNFLFLV